MTFKTLSYEKRDSEAWITLNQPDKLNALGVEGSSELRQALDELMDDRDARVLVLTGSGRAFCAGGDVASFHAHGEEAPRVLRAIIFNLHTAISYLLDLQIPVVAGINGVTAGAGMGLFMAADMAIAVESARFTMAYTAIGATPDGSSTFFLPRLVSTRRAMELALTNRTLTAQEALEWGLVNQVVAEEQYEAALRKLVEQLKNGPTRAFGNTRRLIRQSLYTPLATQLEDEGNTIAAMGRTADFREGVAAFVEKRKPGFSGR